MIKNKKQSAQHIETTMETFAICVDGIVQITMNVDKILANLYDLKPEIIRCKKDTVPGMTIEEAAK